MRPSPRRESTAEGARSIPGPGFYTAGWLAFLALLAWRAVGQWGAVGIEGDDLALALAERLSEGRGFGYAYAFQPGANGLVFAISRAAGIDGMQAAWALTVVSALLFVVVSVRALAPSSGLPAPWFGVVLLLNQEVLVGANFANGTAPAALLWVAGYALQRGGRRLAAALLFAAAIGCRLDSAALVAGVIVASALESRDRSGGVRAAAALAAAVAGLAALAYALGGVGPAQLSAYLEGALAANAGAEREWQRLASWLVTFPPVLLVLAALGIARLAKARERAPLIAVLVPALPLLLLASRSLISPKQLLLATPFLSLAAAQGAAALAERWRAGSRGPGLAVAALLAVHLLVGARLSGGVLGVPMEPVLASWETPLRWTAGNSGERRSLVLELGCGPRLPTSDGARAGSGILLAPAEWRLRKSRGAAFQRALDDWARGPADAGLVAVHDWFPLQVLYRALLRGGWQPAEEPTWAPRATLAFTRGAERLRVEYALGEAPASTDAARRRWSPSGALLLLTDETTRAAPGELLLAALPGLRAYALAP